jgi:hypothetical protein
VRCPQKSATVVNVMEACAPCRHFATASPEGITCTGSMRAYGAKG